MDNKHGGLLLWIEGSVGSGKSCLSETLSKQLNLRLMREPVEENPYLEDFYKDPKKHAFAMQLHLLELRSGMQDLAAAEVLWGNQYQGVVLDRGLPGDHAFCRMHVLYGNIDARNYDTYRLAYVRRTNQMKPPSMMLYLDVTPEVALSRIKKRARGAEVGVTLDYLKDLRDQYYKLIEELQNGEHEWAGKVEVVKVDWNTDNLPTEPIVQMIADKYRLKVLHV